METSWQIFRESTISRQVDALIESDLAAYRKAHEQKEVDQIAKNHQERSGINLGVKRGTYKRNPKYQCRNCGGRKKKADWYCESCKASMKINPVWYKKREPVGPRTNLASSKYYDTARNASAS